MVNNINFKFSKYISYSLYIKDTEVVDYFYPHFTCKATETINLCFYAETDF